MRRLSSLSPLLFSLLLAATTGCSGSVVADATSSAAGSSGGASSCAWTHTSAFTASSTVYADALAQHVDVPEAIDGSADGVHLQAVTPLFLVAQDPLKIRGIHLDVLSTPVEKGTYLALWGQEDGGGELLIAGATDQPTPISSRDLAFTADLAENLSLWNKKVLRVMILSSPGDEPDVKITPLCD